MRKGLVVSLCVLVVVLVFGTLAGCPTPGGSSDPLVGTWSGLGGFVVFTFTSYGTFTESLFGIPLSGNYTENKGASTIHLTALGVTVGDYSYVFGPGNSTLTLTGISGTSGIYPLTRQ